jgi:hypothetical protein
VNRRQFVATALSTDLPPCAHIRTADVVYEPTPRVGVETMPGVVANGFEVPGWKPDSVVEVPTRYLRAFLYTFKADDKAAT